MGAERLGEHVRRKYAEEVRRLQAYWPAELVTLEELGSRRQVRLLDGSYHELDEADVVRLLSAVPRYFWPFMRVPLLLSYVKTETGLTRYVVVGDRWQRRLAEIMATGDYSAEGLAELNPEQFFRVLKNYRSLVFVSLSI